MSLVTKPDGTHEVVPYDLDCAASVSLTTRLPAGRWGQRNKSTWIKTQSRDVDIGHGIKKVCFTQPVILPKYAAEVEPSLHQPQRFAGSAALGTPFYMKYHYYKKFGSAGRGATTSSTHNFPTGSMPQPRTVYGGVYK